MSSSNDFLNDPRKKQEMRGRPIADKIYKQWLGDVVIDRHEKEDGVSILDLRFAIDDIITIDNGQDIDDGRAHGSRFYTAVVPGKRIVSGSMDIWFDDDIEYKRFWGASAAVTPANVGATVPLIYTWDTGIEAATGYNYGLVVTIPAAVYESTTVNLSGGRIKQHIDWDAEYDTATLREILVELLNTKTGYT